MKALAKDPRYKFSEGDKGRAEIMAYIQERLAKIRARAAARLQHARPRPSRSEAHAARAGARRARRLRRRRLDRRQDPRQVLDQPADHRPAQQVQPARPRRPRGDPRPRLAGRICQQAAADPHAARLQRLFRRLGALRRAAGRRARRLRRLPVGRLGYLQSIAFRAAAWWSTPASTPSAGPASRASSSSSTSTARTRSKSRARSTAIARGRARRAATRSGTATINRLRDKAKAELGPKYDLRQFDDTVVLGGNVPMDVLAKNVDEYIARTKAA